MLSATGLQLEAPSPGDVVTVKIRPPSGSAKAPAFAGNPSMRHEMEMLQAMFGNQARPPDHENMNHYRINAIWRVRAVNGSSAVVEQVYPKPFRSALLGPPTPEIWAIDRHIWFDASELLAAVEQGNGDAR